MHCLALEARLAVQGYPEKTDLQEKEGHQEELRRIRVNGNGKRMPSVLADEKEVKQDCFEAFERSHALSQAPVNGYLVLLTTSITNLLGVPVTFFRQVSVPFVLQNAFQEAFLRLFGHPISD